MSEREQIRSAWRTVVELVSVSRYRRQTPAAIKQQAVDSGLPEPPVSTLLGAFRAVEYGERDPTVRAESAVDAATQVEAAAQSMAEAAQDEETSTDELADATGGKSADATGEKSADATGDEPTADTREESE